MSIYLTLQKTAHVVLLAPVGTRVRGRKGVAPVFTKGVMVQLASVKKTNAFVTAVQANETTQFHGLHIILTHKAEHLCMLYAYV